MQQPASRAVKAARKRGVHAEGLRAYLSPSADGVFLFSRYRSCHVMARRIMYAAVYIFLSSLCLEPTNGRRMYSLLA